MLISFHHSRTYSKGFTLIELLVVMSIMLIMTGLLILRQSRFDSATLLRSLAYSVALSVRQSQVYGTSVVGTTNATCTGGFASGGTCFVSAYGVHFTSGTNNGYSLFADTNGNGRWDSGEDVKNYALGTGYIIAQACVNQISPAITICWPGGLSTLDIAFRRPNPDACFSSDATANALGPTACSTGATAVYSSASIQLQHTGDTSNTRNVCIYKSGQISVQAPGIACP